jgi:pimeloyl-ACP methyl ester carboxylesterase
MQYIYPAVSWAYLAIPLLSIVVAIRAARRRHDRHPLHVVLRAWIMGLLLGAGVALTYRSLGNFDLPIMQLLRAAYTGAAAMCVLYGLNWLLWIAVSRMLRIDHHDTRPPSIIAQVLAGCAQALLIVAIGTPYLGSVLLLYRPKAPSVGNPQSILNTSFESVSFNATDGTRIAGWWIPATRNHHTDNRGSDKKGRATVLLCHGFGADKSRDLFLVESLVANGYNVLAIDLRAHGESGGQFTGFGGVESRDVLGAIRYLHREHTDASRRIVGLGEGLGAVALIEAAADSSDEGQSIAAIAAYNPYDRFSQVVSDAASRRTVGPGHWIVMNTILPLASAQIGADLHDLSAATALKSLWPRPLLILGDRLTHEATAAQSFDLYQQAYQPKYGYWSDDAGANAVLHDTTAALTVRIFFDEAKSIL